MIPPIIAPMVAQGLSSLANATLVKGMQWLKSATGLDLQAGMPSSEELDTLRQFAMEHEEELLKIQLSNNQLELRREEIYLKDTQDARMMQMTALEQDDLFSKRFVYWFALLWSVVCAVYVFMITFTTIPPDNVRFADTILGFLIGSVLGQIFGYFYGTSRLAQSKDAVINTTKKDKT